MRLKLWNKIDNNKYLIFNTNLEEARLNSYFKYSVIDWAPTIQQIPQSYRLMFAALL